MAALLTPEGAWRLEHERKERAPFNPDWPTRLTVAELGARESQLVFNVHAYLWSVGLPCLERVRSGGGLCRGDAARAGLCRDASCRGYDQVLQTAAPAPCPRPAGADRPPATGAASPRPRPAPT